MTTKMGLDVHVVTHKDQKNILKLFFLFAFLGFSAYLLVIVIGLNILKERMYEDKKREIKNIVNSVYSVIEYIIHDKNIKNKKEEIKKLIKTIRFEKNNYFWIFTNAKPPVMIMHPYLTHLNGKPLINTKYNSATLIEYNNKKVKLHNENLFVAMTEILAHSNEGFILYKWPKPGKNGITKEYYEKLSYIKLIPEYNWVIGAGIYIDDIQKEFKKALKNYIIFTVIISVIMLFLTITIFIKILKIQKRIKTQQEKIEKMAFTDALTEVLNRTSFNSEINKLIAKKRPFSVIFIDIDKFKEVNDTYGHEIGDKLLVEIVRRIKEIVKDAVVARLGGDEFVILSNIENTDEIVKDLNEKLKEPYFIDDIKIDIISASIGVSHFPQDGKDRYSLLKKADIRMYEDKKRKKNE
jgi:diguanylate cyclase (GGDEF)-like protein